ncbi:MAG TPA: fibronectin type III domain-containing protein, partial [Flavisolibacter sp.]|nr:fibronectin type III domain-containing protein [Flavisolibacter sp.]
MKRFIKTIATFLIAACFFMQHSHAQSVIDPNDPLVTYNPAAPPALPPGGQIGKWVRTVRVGWNSTAWKAYILNGVPFRVKFPTTYNHTAVDGKKYPAIVFFHGLGEKGPRTDNEFSMANGGPVFNSAVTSGKFDGFVIIPQSEGGWGTNHYAVVAQILDYMATNNKLDIFRVTTNGLSAGGNATWDMMINYPQHISQVLPMSGIAVGHRDPAKMAIFKYKPIWYFQGGLDGNPAPATADEVRFAIAGVGGNFKYTLYPNLGHGTWSTAWNETDFFPFCMRVYGSNPWTLFGRTEFCPGDPINVTVGVTPGYSAYEWSKNGEVIPGATGNSIQVNQVGIYAARMRKGTVWSEWSPVPVHIKIKAPTVTPPITVSGLMSKHLPALDTANVTLQVPEGYESYVWQKVGNNTTLSTDNTLNVNTTGDYIVRVTELYGCSSSFSAPFTVISADGPNKPSPATNLLASTLSKTSIRLDWSDNPTPQHNETGYEIYQGLQAGGPYKLIAITAANAISYTVNGLTPKTKYFFKLRGVNETAASAASNESTATTESDIQAPTAPSDLVLTSKSRTSLGLSWGPSTDDIGVVRYEIYLNGSKSYTTTNTSFTVYGLEYKKFYNIVVRAVDAAGNQSANSNQVTGQPVLTGLNYKYYTYTGNWSVLPNFNTLTPHTIGTMPNVSLSPRTQNDRFAFLWEGFITIPASGTYYFRTNSDDGSRLYLGPKDGTASPYDFSATPLVNNDGVHGSQDATSAAINLAAGTYPIAITFFENDGGEGMSVRWRTPSSGNNFVAIPDALFAEPVINPGSIPAKPTALSATVVSHKQINLSWKDNSDNETGFELYRSTSANSGFSVIAVVPANTESYSDSTLVPNTRYYYKLRAISTEGESALIYKFAEAQWKLDNNYTDASGNNRDLIPAGGPTFDGVSKAEGTHAVKQNGNTHQLSLNTNDGWLRNEYNEKSIAFWMKSSNNSSRLIVDIGGNDDGLAIALNNNQIFAGVASNSNRRSIAAPFT